MEQKTVLGSMGTANWSAEDGTAYEVALEGINHVVGAYSGLIAQAQAAGDAERAQALIGEQGAWAARKKGLTPGRSCRSRLAHSRVHTDPEPAAGRGMTDVDRTRYVLTEAENERIFREQIVPQTLAGLRRSSRSPSSSWGRPVRARRRSPRWPPLR
ncbi:hypothetical protein ACFV0D_40690 [Streptomyces sp. NPDC059556]|uniref:hypothetical protein n=1 Tax=Streptomyces sp. NPDC059556 TaxID=3346863 RepID=UPI0036BFA2FD